jgi:hypothetical protein
MDAVVLDQCFDVGPARPRRDADRARAGAHSVRLPTLAPPQT